MLRRTRLPPTSFPFDLSQNRKLLSPSFPGERKGWFNEAARRQHPPPQYVQVSSALSHKRSASLFIPAHLTPTSSGFRVIREREWVKGLVAAASRATASSCASSVPPRVQHWTAPAPAQQMAVGWLTREPTKQRTRRLEAALQGFGCGQAASLNRLSSGAGETGVWCVAKPKGSN